MADEEHQKALAVTGNPAVDDDGAVDDGESTRCLSPDVPTEHLTPLRVGKPHSLSAATLAKCNVAATKYKCWLLLLLGVSLVTIALAIWFLDPVELYIRKMLSFHEGSFLFNHWKNPPVPVNHQIFVFNVTNADGFLHHGEKLRVDEVGPYTYAETLNHTAVKFNDNGTVTYIPKRIERFSEELSVRNAKEDIVVVPNLTLIALVSLAQKLPFYVRWSLPKLLAPLNLQPFISVTVDELMLGYDDPLVTLANTFLPATIPMSKLGLLDIVQRQNDTVTMFTSPDDPSRTERKAYSIDLLNGSPGLEYWGYGETYVETDNGTLVPELLKCNSVRGSYEGLLFPRFYPENETVWLFRKYCCRPLPAVFEKNVTMNGLKLRQYKVKEDTFETADKNPDNSCYCDGGYKRDCLPAGIAEITPCYFNVPAAISFPHFLYGDERLVQAIDGLSPDEERHHSYFMLLSDLGVPIEAHCKLQVNLIARTSSMRSIAAFDNMILPLIWFDTIGGPYPDDLMFLMKLAVNEGPVIQKVLAALFLISGLILVLMVTSQQLFPLKHMKNKLSSIRFRQISET